MFTLGPDLVKMLGYLFYLYIHLSTSGVPVQIIHDTFVTVHTFTKHLRDLLYHQRAISYIDDRCSDSTPEEVDREVFCVVCWEEMYAWQQTDALREGPAQVEQRLGSRRRATKFKHQSSRPKRLPCGHTVHFGCLKIWFESQKACPICRRPVRKRAA